MINLICILAVNMIVWYAAAELNRAGTPIRAEDFE